MCSLWFFTNIFWCPPTAAKAAKQRLVVTANWAQVGAQSVQCIGCRRALLIATHDGGGTAAASACACARRMIGPQATTGIVTSVAIAHYGFSISFPVTFLFTFPFPFTFPVPFRFRAPSTACRLFRTASTFLFFCLIGFDFVVAVAIVVIVVAFIRWGRRAVASFIFVVVVILGYDPRCTRRAQNKTKILLLSFFFSILFCFFFSVYFRYFRFIIATRTRAATTRTR